MGRRPRRRAAPHRRLGVAGLERRRHRAGALVLHADRPRRPDDPPAAAPPAARGDAPARDGAVRGGVRQRLDDHGAGERPRPHRGVHRRLRPRARPRSRHVLPAGLRRPDRRRPLVVALRRAPRVGAPPRRRRRGRRRQPVLPRRRPDGLAAARRAGAAPARRGRGHRARPAPRPRRRPACPRRAHPHRGARHHRRQPCAARPGRPGDPAAGPVARALRAGARGPHVVDARQPRGRARRHRRRPGGHRAHRDPPRAAGRRDDRRPAGDAARGAGDLRRPHAARGSWSASGPASTGTPCDAVAFAWAGGAERGEPHYYRLQGPRLLAEWDNTQRAVNHAHSVWRDPGHDFGLDLLGEHLTEHHGHGTHDA